MNMDGDEEVTPDSFKVGLADKSATLDNMLAAIK